MNFIRSLDFLGIKPVLKIAGNDSSKTLFGGTLSIFLALLLLAGCGYFFGMLVSRTNYSVVQSDRFNSTQFMDLTNYEMSFYVTNGLGERIQDAYRVFGVTGLFFFYVNQIDADGKISTKMTAKPVKMEQCNLTRHFGGNGERWKDEKFITESMCLPLDQKYNASLPYGAQGFFFMQNI